MKDYFVGKFLDLFESSDTETKEAIVTDIINLDAKRIWIIPESEPFVVSILVYVDGVYFVIKKNRYHLRIYLYNNSRSDLAKAFESEHRNVFLTAEEFDDLEYKIV